MVNAVIASMRRWYPLILLVLAGAASLAAWSALPASMAVHWDLNGNASGWIPRSAGAALLPAMIALLWAALRAAGARVAPANGSAAMQERLSAGLLVMLFATHLMVLAVNLGVRIPMERAPLLIVGALFIVIGRALPLATVGSALGLRTPWTLSSARVWMRTHLLAGQVMTACGAAMLVAAVVLPADLAMPVMVAAIVVAAVAPAAYSWLTWTRESRQ